MDIGSPYISPWHSTPTVAPLRRLSRVFLPSAANKARSLRLELRDRRRITCQTELDPVLLCMCVFVWHSGDGSASCLLVVFCVTI